MNAPLSLREIQNAGTAALQQIDANERDLDIFPLEVREHLRTMNEMMLKLSESHGLSIEIAADASHPHDGFKTSIVMVKEWSGGARRLVWSTNIHINDLG